MLGQLLLLAHLAVVCDRSDSLRPIAEEIAREEGTTVGDSWSDAHAEYLIWVVEPGRLSDQVIVNFAHAWRDRFPQTAVGLISGRTPDQARAMWLRGRHVRAYPAHAFDASRSISPQRFVEALNDSGYLTFAGHGGATYLRLGPDTVLQSTDVPSVPNLVLGTESCNVFRPWVRDSIALAFVENGAAAFAGFAYSPVAGFLIGGFGGLPFRYTSPEFPIGRVVQLQNHGAMQAFAALPIYLLLGDPRIALASQPPYRVVSDETDDRSRRITLAGAPHGLLPVRIQGGAAYHFVEASGTAAAEGHGFYNARLQAFDSGADKFVLVDSTGGALVLRLQKAMPWWWPVKTGFVEALDNALVSFGNGTATCVLVLAVGFAMAIAVLRRGATKRAVVLGAAAGVLLAALHVMWVLARVDHITVISKTTGFNPLAIADTFVLTSSAGALYMAASSRTDRAFALILATFPAWFPAVFHFAFTLGANLKVFRPQLGASLYTHNMAMLAASSSLIVFLVVVSVFSGLRHLLAGHTPVITPAPGQ
ncbi:hypothetical protein [uncultured Paludibaculum sp.]|uniref:hypothetical protein n=1 Tax=uncultured Paludibaculum sp. TaxID=1765020 RepID=UPI002AAA806A|nr:hypothetical protein [uncultured Paludibaculum sp.]